MTTTYSVHPSTAAAAAATNTEAQAQQLWEDGAPLKATTDWRARAEAAATAKQNGWSGYTIRFARPDGSSGQIDA